MGIDFRFPPRPDWDWLRATYPGNVLLHVDCPLAAVAGHLRGRLAYLATPYSKLVVNDDLQFQRALAFDVEIRTARWARRLAVDGVTVASPILTVCAIIGADVEGHIDPLDDTFWTNWCRPMLTACGSVVIPPMAGWDESRGVWGEACWALRHNVPVWLIAAAPKQGEVS